MDPVSVGLIGVGVNQVSKAIELAWTWRRGKKGAAADQATEVRAAQELALRLWGSLLFETRRNCERVRHIVRESRTNKITFAPFDFSISNALMRDFCRVVPTPRLLGEFQWIVAALKRIDFFQRLGGEAPPISISLGSLGTGLAENQTGYVRAVAFAKDALDKGLVDRFNALNRLGDEFGNALYEGEWIGAPSGMFPESIDPDADINHSMI